MKNGKISQSPPCSVLAYLHGTVPPRHELVRRANRRSPEFRKLRPTSELDQTLGPCAHLISRRAARTRPQAECAAVRRAGSKRLTDRQGHVTP